MYRIDPKRFTPAVAQILSKHASYSLPLIAPGTCFDEDAKLLRDTPVASLFPNAKEPQAAVGGLLLFLGCWEQSHKVVQDVHSREGSYWHALAHRMEPDYGNAAYWFRRVGAHPIFPKLHEAGTEVLARHADSPLRLKSTWDPFLFIDWCEKLRPRSGDGEERVLRQMQDAEWSLLFAWCALNDQDS